MFALSIFLRRYLLDVSCDSWILSGHAWFTCFFSCYTRICRWIASTADLWFYAVLSRAVLVRHVVTWERLATTWKGFFIFSRCITDSNGFQRLYIRIYMCIYTHICNNENVLTAQDQPGQDAKSLGVAGRQHCGIMRPHHPTQRSLVEKRVESGQKKWNKHMANIDERNTGNWTVHFLHHCNISGTSNTRLWKISRLEKHGGVTVVPLCLKPFSSHQMMQKRWAMSQLSWRIISNHQSWLPWRPEKFQKICKICDIFLCVFCPTKNHRTEGDAWGVEGFLFGAFWSCGYLCAAFSWGATEKVTPWFSQNPSNPPIHPSLSSHRVNTYHVIFIRLTAGLSPIRMKANELSSQSCRPCGFSRQATWQFQWFGGVS